MIDRRVFMGALAASVLARPAIARNNADYAPWTDLLGRYLRAGNDGVMRVAYGAWKKQGREQLAGFIKSLEAVDVQSLSKAEQFAFWVNLYNAKTIDIVLEYYPVNSIRDIDLGGGFFANGPWSAKLVTVSGRAMSLDDIEHNTLRKSWREPRVHYAVNCASIGCPNLQKRAFEAGNLESLLNAGASQYINSKRGVRLSEDGVIASKIYDWFGEDFGSSDDLYAHWLRYADEPLKLGLKNSPPIASYDYDWSLNDAG